jgi:hypothetical protein
MYKKLAIRAVKTKNAPLSSLLSLERAPIQQRRTSSAALAVAVAATN